MKRDIIITIILCLVVVILIGIMIPPLNKAREKTRRISCASNIFSMGLSFKQYAMDYDGHFPDKNGAAGFELLRWGDYLTDYNIFGCPSSTVRVPDGYHGPLKEEYVAYVYRGGLTENDSPDSAIVWDKPGNHKDYGNVLYVDGHVNIFYGKDWVKNIESITKNTKYKVFRKSPGPLKRRKENKKLKGE